MILAGDIGGTKTVVALYDIQGETLKLVRDGTFPSKDHAALEEILAKFLHGQANLSFQAACFGVAGAVIEGKCQTTNLPWKLDEVLAIQVGLARRYQAMVDLGAGCGMRQGEIFGLAEEDLDLVDGWVHVQRQLKRVWSRLVFGAPWQ